MARTSLGPLSLVLLAACSSSSGSSPLTTDSGTHDTGAVVDAHVTHEAAVAHDATPDTHVVPPSHDAAPEAAAEAGPPPPQGDAGGPTDAGRAPSPAGDASASTASHLFAIHHLWLGDTEPDDSFSPDSTNSVWKTFGYNIDGLITTQFSTDVCTPDTAAGATTADQIDGVNGIDNSFGENIVPLLASALPNLSQNVSNAIAGGSFNVLIDTVGLSNSPTQTNVGLTGALFNGAAYGGTPPLTDGGFFQPTDEWPVFSGSLKGSLEAGALETFPSAYVTNGVWVNGTPGDVTLQLLLQGQALVLAIHHAQITFTHSVDAAGQDHATNGFISGVLKTSELVQEINVVAQQQQYCSEAKLLLNFIAASSDIMADGTNAPGQACDGVSIGLAFDADGIADPTTVVPSVDAGAQKGCVDGG